MEFYSLKITKFNVTSYTRFHKNDVFKSDSNLLKTFWKIII